MRESDCSVAMVGGSSAARNACDFVLLGSNFSAMVNVLREGRRVINNIERVAALFLVNTIFSVILSTIYLFLPYPIPYVPSQMTPVNTLTTGIPSFFLALRANYARPAGRFFANIFEYALPAGILIVLNTIYLQCIGIFFQLPMEETSTMIVFLIGIVGFTLLLRITPPFTRGVKIMLGLLITAFLALFVFGGKFFTLTSLISRNIFFFMPMLYFNFHVQGYLHDAFRRGFDRFEQWQKASNE
jgi:cation-transporting ATPase E